MPKTVTITLGEANYQASYFNVEDALEVRELLGSYPSDPFAIQAAAACRIIAIGLAAEAPEMTAERVRETRMPLSHLFTAMIAILKFNEYEFDTGKAVAPANAM